MPRMLARGTAHAPQAAPSSAAPAATNTALPESLPQHSATRHMAAACLPTRVATSLAQKWRDVRAGAPTSPHHICLEYTQLDT